jgi:hypothetical protein
MSSAIAVILALSLAAEPLAQTTAPKIPRTGILIMGSLGFAAIATGTGFDIYGRTVSQPGAPVAPGTAAPAESYFIGGISLIATGLCLVLLSVLLTHWYTPKDFYGVRW